MDKQNVNTTPSMKGKGDSSSSHYRISSVVDESEQVLAKNLMLNHKLPLKLNQVM